MKPQQMEWERLYEESLQLKALVNQFKEENVKLKTRNTNLEVYTLYLPPSLERLPKVHQNHWGDGGHRQHEALLPEAQH